MQVGGPPRGNGRPKRMWMEVVKIDLKKYNLSWLRIDRDGEKEII